VLVRRVMLVPQPDPANRHLQLVMRTDKTDQSFAANIHLAAAGRRKHECRCSGDLMPHDCQCLRNARISLAPSSSMRLIVAVIATDVWRIGAGADGAGSDRGNGRNSENTIGGRRGILICR